MGAHGHAKEILGLPSGKNVLFVFKNDNAVDIADGKHVYNYNREGADAVSKEEWVLTGQVRQGIPPSVKNAERNNTLVVCVRQPIEGDRVVEGIGFVKRVDVSSNKVFIRIDRALTKGEKCVITDEYVSACAAWRLCRPTRDPRTGSVIGWKKLCIMEVCGVKPDPNNRTATCFLTGKGM